MSSNRRKPEDTADGCRALAQADRERASSVTNVQVRACFESSAAAWSARAGLLDRLEAGFNARAAANLQEKPRRQQVRGIANG